MKKKYGFLALILATAVLAATLTACGEEPTKAPESVPETTVEPTTQEVVKDYSDEIDMSHYLPEYTFAGNENSLKSHLTEAPVYALKEGASVDEMRAMAVKVLYDMITFQWTPDNDFKYMKVTNGNDRDFLFQKNIVYGGMPYSDGGRCLFNMLEYYDYKTGVMVGMKELTNPNHLLGNSCAGQVNQANAAVCANLLATSTYYLVPRYGYMPTDNYEFDDSITRYTDNYSTGYIIEVNGRDRMCEALAKCLPGDALDRNANEKGGDHVMMVYSAPTVVRDANGKIDPDKSTLCIIDQWASDYLYEFNGQQESIRGRINKEFTFTYLLDNDFIPLTPADYLSETGYVKAEAKLDREVTTYEELKKAVVLTNFRTIKVEGQLVSESGTVVYVNKNVIEPADYIKELDRKVKCSTVMAKTAAKKVMRDDRTYTYRIQVLVASGETFTVAEVPVTIDQIGAK